jgi:hypothetical protein
MPCVCQATQGPQQQHAASFDARSTVTLNTNGGQFCAKVRANEFFKWAIEFVDGQVSHMVPT